MNKTLWNYYRNSEDGKRAVKLFDPNTKDIDAQIGEIGKFLQRWDKEFIPDNLQFLVYCYYVNLKEQGLLPHQSFTREAFRNLIENYVIQDFSCDENGHVTFDNSVKGIVIPKNKFRVKAATIHGLSLMLYYLHPSFKPMLLVRRFDIFQRSCDLLGIEIPPIPHTKNYEDYLLYFYDLCRILNAFQKENKLSDAEFCACIYDYGGRVLLDDSEKEKCSILPQPTNVWLTGASGKGDFSFLDSIQKSSQENKSQIWAGNERTRTGDIIVMYCKSPRSYIHSI